MRESSEATINKNNLLSFFDKDNACGNELPEYITVKSGLKVRVADAEWRLLQNKGKGNTLKLYWLRASDLSSKEIELTLLVFIHYVIGKSASTACTVAIGVRPVIKSGFPSVSDLKIMWSSLGLSKKKAANQFFGTLVKLGYREFKEHHNFTSKNIGSDKVDPLSPFTGRLNELEFDSVVQNLHLEISKIDFGTNKDFNFFAKRGNSYSFNFSRLRSLIGTRLLIAILRRPLQIAMIKWSDIIPVGCTFGDELIPLNNEVYNIGVAALQLRLYRIKNSVKEARYRSTPEKYPMALSEDLSLLLYRYKMIFIRGVQLALLESGISSSKGKTLDLIKNMPVFISSEFFGLKIKSLSEFEAIFTHNSSLYHLNEALLTNAVKGLKGVSDRTNNLSVTSNRLRHTALTRGAEEGLDSAQLSKLTGVTEPAARRYIDLDYRSRRLIDDRYVANDFLRNAFSVPVQYLDKDNEVVLGANFEEIGGVKSIKSCSQCLAKMGKPIGCYGCPNFLPLLDADHHSVLEQAEAKLKANMAQFKSPVINRSVEKLERQIEKIRITITLCDNIIDNKGKLNA